MTFPCVLIKGIFPLSTHASSKGFAVSVMEFDPTTLKAKAFYDFGLLLIEKLPESGNSLFRVMGDFGLNLWKTNKIETLGTLYRHQPQFTNHYIPQEEHSSKLHYWNYDQVPTGSIHFMTNSVWQDAGASRQGVVIYDVSKQELKKLYLNNQAWINVYDHVVGSTYSENTSALEEINKLEQGDACVNIQKFSNIPESMFVSHEIIIGGEQGRNFVFQEKPKYYFGPSNDNCIARQ